MKNTIKAIGFMLLLGLVLPSCTVVLPGANLRTAAPRHDNGLHKGWFKAKHKGHKDASHKWKSPGKIDHHKHKGHHDGNGN